MQELTNKENMRNICISKQASSHNKRPMKSSPEEHQSGRIVGPIAPIKQGDTEHAVPEIMNLDALPFITTGKIDSMPDVCTFAEGIQIEGLEGRVWQLPMESIIPFPYISDEYLERDPTYLEKQMRESGPKSIVVAFIMIKGVKRALIIDGEQTFRILKRQGAKLIPIRVTIIGSLEEANAKSLKINVGRDMRNNPMKAAYGIEKAKHTQRPWLTNTQIASLLEQSVHTLSQYTLLLDLDMRTQIYLSTHARGLSITLARKLARVKNGMRETQPDWNEYDAILGPLLERLNINPQKEYVPPQEVENELRKKVPFYSKTEGTVTELVAYDGQRDTTIQDLRDEITQLRAQLATALAQVSESKVE